MRKKRRLNKLAILLAAMLAFSSVSAAAAEPIGGDAAEELVIEESVPEEETEAESDEWRFRSQTAECASLAYPPSQTVPSNRPWHNR